MPAKKSITVEVKAQEAKKLYEVQDEITAFLAP